MEVLLAVVGLEVTTEGTETFGELKDKCFMRILETAAIMLTAAAAWLQRLISTLSSQKYCY